MENELLYNGAPLIQIFHIQILAVVFVVFLKQTFTLIVSVFTKEDS